MDTPTVTHPRGAGDASPTTPDHAAAAGVTATSDERLVEELLVDELLIEEISIDGMCGVY
jgi:mycofactocin precursor